MIVAENSRPPVALFQQLMQKTDDVLNLDAVQRPDYYAKRNGNLLEGDVYSALTECARGTPFENTISLVSGATFPDILIHRFYGVEVKSTIKNQWKSIGSSILESTRNADVERIFLTFGKLGKPIQFRSRPYEDVLSGISVTHYPRYQIDMELRQGETIFDKMGVSYDELRRMDNPVSLVSKYYKRQLKPGESLWWASDSPEEAAAPPVLRLWTSLNPEQRHDFTAKAYALFPEILGRSPDKYQRYALWLVQNCSVVNTNIRDQFSAGGKVRIETGLGTFDRVPAAYGRIQTFRNQITETILTEDSTVLRDCWEVQQISNDRMRQWFRLVANIGSGEGNGLSCVEIYRMLCGIFHMEPEY